MTSTLKFYRVFHYNEKIATYQDGQSPMCEYCNMVPETYVHLFWDCKYAVLLWTAIQEISYDYVDMEYFTQFKCLLSNFQHPLLCILATIVKNYIHICRWTNVSPSICGLLKVVKRTREIQFKKCTKRNNPGPFYSLWECLAYDIAMNDMIKYWEIAEDK